jgi:hypothetical protein
MPSVVLAYSVRRRKEEEKKKKGRRKKRYGGRMEWRASGGHTTCNSSHFNPRSSRIGLQSSVAVFQEVYRTHRPAHAIVGLVELSLPKVVGFVWSFLFLYLF